MTKQVQEDSAAAATIKTHATANKTEMLNKAILAMSGMSIEDLSHYLNDTLAQVGHEADGVKDVSGHNQSSLNMKPSAASTAMKESAKEDLALIFAEGVELSEEVKDSVSTLFEAALESRLVVEREELVEEMNAKLDEAYTTMSEEMSSKLDVYLDSIVETWLAENEVAIESAIRSELTQDFLSGLQKLFSEHFINVPEDKVDVVEELASKVTELESRLDASINENSALKSTVLENKKNDVVALACEGLTLNTAEKLRSLVETVEFSGDLDAFTAKVATLKEGVVAVKSTPEASTGILVEESDPDAALKGNAAEPGLHPGMSQYMSAISRNARR